MKWTKKKKTFIQLIATHTHTQRTWQRFRKKLEFYSPNFQETFQFSFDPIGVAGRNEILDGKQFSLCWGNILVTLESRKEDRTECALTDTTMNIEYVLHVRNMSFQFSN